MIERELVIPGLLLLLFIATLIFQLLTTFVMVCVRRCSITSVSHVFTSTNFDYALLLLLFY